MPEKRPTLREMLRGDWGDDLPIAGGFGQSAKDPIVVTASGAEVVARTQMHVLRGLGRGRRIIWRTLGRRFTDDFPGVEQFKIKTVQTTPTEVITQIENYYFDVSALLEKASELANGLEVGGSLVMPVPCELGWLHCSGIVDNNAHSPGAGHTVACGAPGIKATLYVYDWNCMDIPSSVEDPIALAEFEGAALAISQQPHMEAWPDPEFDGKCLRRYFKIGRSAEQGGLVALTTCNRKFLKMRATWVRDRFIDAAAAGWVQSVLSQYLEA